MKNKTFMTKISANIYAWLAKRNGYDVEIKEGNLIELGYSYEVILTKKDK